MYTDMKELDRATHVRHDGAVKAHLVAGRDGIALYHAEYTDGSVRLADGGTVPRYIFKRMHACTLDRFQRDFAPC